MGVSELQRGDLRTARDQAERGRLRARAARDPAWERRFLVLEAEILVEEWRHPEALSLLDTEAWAGTPPDPVDVRALLARGIAQCFSRAGSESRRQAEANLEKALRLSTDLRDPGLVAEAILRRGTCAVFREEYAAAEAYLQEALAAGRSLRRLHLEAKATNNLGLVRMRTARYDDAADWFRRASELASELHARVIGMKALTNLGWCYYTLGDYDRALGFLTRAETMAEEDNNEAELLYALQIIGNTHYRRGELDQAGHAYRRALAAARNVDDAFVLGELHSNLGIVALEQGRYDEAETSVREAKGIETKLENLQGRQYSLLAESQIWAGRGDFEKADALNREVLASPDATRELQWEARAALASLRLKTNRPAEAEKEFREALRIMEQSHREIREAEHKISFFSSLGRFYDSYVGFLVDGKRVAEAIELADRSRARLLRDMPGPGRGAVVSAKRFREVARALDAVLLLYSMAPRRSFLWVVTPRQVRIHILPDEAEIRRQVQEHQALILQSRDPLAEGAKEAEWLYRTLVGPAEAEIPKGSRVVVVPDGPLHQINLETLVVPGTRPRYWIEDVTLTTAPSLSLLAVSRNERPPDQAPKILLIGDAISPSQEFPPLPHAAKEVERIAEQFAPTQRTVYSGARADPSIYKTAEPGRFSFIHFATHANANPLIPLDSAVILSAKGDAYKLYAREIADVPLKADLVTLSACRSAGSRTYAGEGLVGLAWAFLSAGAANVVGGLWNVEDASTAELMEELYRGLARGRRPAEALRAAKLRLLRSPTAYRKPFYWAPFVIYTRRGEAVGRQGPVASRLSPASPSRGAHGRGGPSPLFPYWRANG